MVEQERWLLEKLLDLRLDDAVEDLRARDLGAGGQAELFRKLDQSFAIEALAPKHVRDRLSRPLLPDLGKIEAAKLGLEINLDAAPSRFLDADCVGALLEHVLEQR